MKTSPSLAIGTLLFGSIIAQAQTILFHANFEDDFAGGSPTLVADGGVWNSFGRGANYVAGAITVQEDVESLFSQAPNKFLRILDAGHFDLTARPVSLHEVVTFSFQFIGRNSADARWTLMNIYGGSGTLNNVNRAHVLSQSLINKQIRADAARQERLRTDQMKFSCVGTLS